MVTTDDEKLVGLSNRIDHLIARNAALTSLFEHLVAPIFLAVMPQQVAVDLVAAARTMDVKLPEGPQKFRVEEEINAIVDRLERRLRSKVR